MHVVFIRLFELTLALLTVAGVTMVGVAAYAAYEGRVPQIAGIADDRVLAAAIAVAGVAYLSLVLGMFYVWVGTYRNTQRMADSMERMAR